MLAPVGGAVYIGRDNIRSLKTGDLAKQMAVVLTERLNVNMTSAYEVVSIVYRIAIVFVVFCITHLLRPSIACIIYKLFTLPLNRIVVF